MNALMTRIERLDWNGIGVVLLFTAVFGLVLVESASVLLSEIEKHEANYLEGKIQALIIREFEAQKYTVVSRGTSVYFLKEGTIVGFDRAGNKLKHRFSSKLFGRVADEMKVISLTRKYGRTYAS